MSHFPGAKRFSGNRWHGGVPPMHRWLRAVVVQPDGCLTWGLQLTSAGYGSLTINGANVYAHRFAYERFVGPIPDGHEIDHLCRNRACCNPAHLEAVTRRINQLRGLGPVGLNAAKTHCVNGHEFTEANTYIRKDTTHPTRMCRACHRERQRTYKLRDTGEITVRGAVVITALWIAFAWAMTALGTAWTGVQ